MLKYSKFAVLIALLTLFLILSALPVSAQSSAPGLDVAISESGVAIYRLGSDGGRSLVIFVPASTGSTVGQGGGSDMDVASADSDIITTGYVIVNTSALNVRSGPGVQYTVLATVAGGDILDVIGRNDGREHWWFVELANGQRGWLNNIHVIIRGDLRGAPVIEHHGVLIKPTLYIGWPGNPIFPSIPHRGIPVCYLPGRSEFEIVGRSKQSTFYQIAATCQDGTPVVGWVEAILGIVRNPAGTAFPVTQDN